MKILVIQLSGAADILLSTLLLRCLKKQVSNAELHLLIRHEQAELLAANPYIDHVHQLHFNSQTTAEELKGIPFDHVINLQADKDAEEILSALSDTSDQKSQKGFERFLQQLFQRNATGHKAEQYLKKASTINVENDGAGLNYFIPRAAEVPYHDIPAAHHAGLIALAVSASHSQQWPLLFLQQLVAAIHHPIILIGSKQDHALAEKVKRPEEVKVYNACGKFSLHETADLVRKSKLVIAAQPFYVQTAAALHKEMVWLKDNKEVPPYYPQPLTKKATTPFDTIKIPAGLFAGSQPSNKRVEAVVNDFVAEIEKAVNRRLRGNV